MSLLFKNFQHYFQHLLFTLKRFQTYCSISCPTIIIEVINNDILQQNSTQSNELHSLTYQYSMEFQFNKIQQFMVIMLLIGPFTIRVFLLAV